MTKNNAEEIFEKYGLSPFDVSEMKSALIDPIASQMIWGWLRRKGLSYKQVDEVIKALKLSNNIKR